MSDNDQHPYESLTPDLVIDAVESQGYLSDARILALNSYENRVYQVGLEDESPIIVKFYRPGRWSREQILEEHAFAQELEALDISVVPPISNKNGITLHDYSSFMFSLYQRKGGHAPELDNMDHLFSLGQLMGRIHNAGSLHTFSYRPEITLQRYAIETSTYLLENNVIPSSLLPAYETLARDLIDKLQRIDQQNDPKIIRLHGDCHVGNILCRDDVFHFVDFDDCINGPAIQDLWMFLSGDRQSKMAQLSELIDGYNEFHDFNAVELNLVEYFRTLRLMHYSAWLARRWKDPAFPIAFPWFNSERYWADHVLELREQMAALDEEPLTLF
ncbi:serine/threonine protein kinase [Sansalvadorimonas sp. 2012CJ34-2]|uniref:Stress response kinase A n=1 Tax=Parendozoicomonas callyspongiae TaxID=2942213 RepID=A0ABT0PIL4_9GAMM|nr:serine/threonine protein kinase [Sansalvadorimonas sp. 2012CJ34-2]MCL6271199.1 serine/threonine protein kinase [Sansalvadorimonas sp. 2012CJ34-2]